MKFDSNLPAVAFFLSWTHLLKIPLCVSVAVSAGFGAILHTPLFAPSLGIVMSGVFFLVCGAAGFNSLQERTADSLFTRTRKRPLVTGRLTGREAIGSSSMLVALGFLLLLFCGESYQPLLLGVTAIILYNGVYTPLKGISVFALFPGGVAGAIPALIGWTSTGGCLADRRAWAILAFFFLWQVPHFCLILLRYQEDYHAVDRPALIKLFSEQSLKRITVVWILAFNVVALSLTLYQNLLVPESRWAISLMAGVLTSLCILLFLRKNFLDYKFLFIILNSCFFCTMLFVAVSQVQIPFGY